MCNIYLNGIGNPLFTCENVALDLNRMLRESNNSLCQIQSTWKKEWKSAFTLCNCKLSAMHKPLIDLSVKIPKGVEVCVFKQKETGLFWKNFQIVINSFVSHTLNMAFEGLDERTETWRNGTLVDIIEDKYKLKWTDDKGEPGESWTSTIRRHVLESHRRWGNHEDGTPLRGAAENHLNHEVRQTIDNKYDTR